MLKIKFEKSKQNIKKIKLIVMISAIFLIIIVSIFFVANLNKYSETEDAEAGSCNVQGGRQNSAGCGSNGGCCDYSQAQSFIGLSDAGCGPSNCVKLDTRYSDNICQYTHFDVCIQKSVAVSGQSGGLQCSKMCYWGCCSPKNGVATEQYKELAGGKIVSYHEYYKGDGMDGRLDGADCSMLRGWAGTKSDFMKPVDIFFSIGKPYDQGGVIFNPGQKADIKPAKYATEVCSMLDNKPDGEFPECRECTGTACNHVYEVDLTEFTDSGVFNGEAGNRIYAYASDQGKVIVLTDGGTASKQYAELSTSCGDSWDGESDELPSSAIGRGDDDDDDDDSGEGGNEPINFDLNLDGELNLQDLNYFGTGYRACNTNSSSPDSTECLKYKKGGSESNLDFTDDDKVDLSDFVEFASAYKVCNVPGDSDSQDSTECKALKGQ